MRVVVLADKHTATAHPLVQESTRHTEAMDAITRYLGVGSYAQWDEQTRQSWLLTELQGKRPLLPRNSSLADLGFDSIVQACLVVVVVVPRSASVVVDVAVVAGVVDGIDVVVGGGGSGVGGVGGVAIGFAWCYWRRRGCWWCWWCWWWRYVVSVVVGDGVCARAT